MANEFIARNGLIALDNSTITGSLNITGSASITDNLGIGTTSTTNKLTINHNASFAGTPGGPTGGGGIHLISSDAASVALSFDTFGGANPQITFRRANGTLLSPSALTSGASLGAITWRGYGATAYANANRGLINLIADENWTDTAQGTLMTFNTVTRGTTSSVERMRIDALGNIGIGTTNPSSRLQVNGDIDIATGSHYKAGGVNALASDGSSLYLKTGTQLYIQNNSSTNLGTITSTGNLGIGTTSPNSALDVRGVIIGGDGSIQTVVSWVSDAGVTGTTSNHAYSLYANNAERMRITAGGNVGIGTTNIGVKFVNSGGGNASGPTLGSGTVGSQALLAGNGLYGMYSGVSNNGDVWHQVQRNDSNSAVYNLLLQPSGGNVGIGTTSPISRFVVNGGTVDTTTYTSSQARIADGTIHLMKTSAGGVFEAVRAMNLDTTAGTTVRLLAASTSDAFNNTNGGKVFIDAIRTSTNMDLAFSLNSTAGAAPVERVRFMGSGNVGIGTASPSTILSVNDNGTGLSFSNAASGNFNIGLLAGTGSQLAYVYQRSNSDLIFGTNNTERMRILANGNVGIGTTSPVGRLNIAGALGGTVGAGGSAIRMTNTDTGNFSSISAGIVGITNDGMQFSTDGTSRVVISGGGNVGIGTTSPSIYSGWIGLDIRGGNGGHLIVANSTGTNRGELVTDGNGFNITAVTNNPLLLKTNDTERMRILANGNIGIGTTNPRAVSGFTTLALNNASNGGLIDFLNNGTVVGQMYNTSAIFHIGSITSIPLAFGTGDNERMRITSGGNVGIGNTNPGSRLEVSGTFRNVLTSGAGGQTLMSAILGVSNGYLINVDTSNNITHTWHTGANATSLFIAANGNIGIGNTSPSVALHIARAAAQSPTIRLQTTDSTTNGAIQWSNSANSVLATIGSNANVGDSSGNLEFMTGGTTTRMLLTSAGNVGIGTTSPIGRLTAAGDGGANTYAGVVRVVNTATTNAWASVSLPDDATTQSQSNNYYFIGRSANISNRIMSFHIPTASDYGSGAQPRFGFYSTGADTLFTIEASTGTAFFKGNVGIGTTSPSNRLHVASSNNEGIFMQGTSNGGHWFNFRSANSNLWSMGAQPGLMGWYNRTDSTYKMVITDGGNVGIGTTEPQRPLEVISDGNNFVSVGVNSIGVGQWAGIHFGYRESNNLYRKSAIVFQRTDLTSNNAQGKIHILNGPQGNANNATLADARLTIAENGNVGISNTSPSARLDVNGDANINGTLTAIVKSFIIDHPTKPGKKLQYGVLEGPEHSVYVRGKLTNGNTITLPDHWHALVDEDTITVNLTPIKHHQNTWVESVNSKYITIGAENPNIECYYTVFAERKDIDKLITEFDKEI